MDVELFTAFQRTGLTAVAGVALGVAAVLWWRARDSRWLVPTFAAAIAALFALGLEWGITAWITAQAPERADFNEYRWVLGTPWGRFALFGGIIAASLVVVLSWVGTAGVASPWRRFLLVLLRGGASLVALVLFLEPAIELRQVTREPNRIAVLVDASSSMGLRDGEGAPTRYERVAELLEASQGTFESWRGRHLVDFFTFGSRLSAASVEAVASGEPAEPATLLRKALGDIVTAYQDRDLAGIVLVSDGVATGDFARGAGVGDAREFLHSLEVPVHTVWAGRPGLKDISVAQVLADEFAFVRTVARVEAVVRSTGMDRQRVPITLSRDGKPLRRKWVTVGPDAPEQRVSFEFTPAKIGKYVYEFSIPVADGEAVAENNRRAFVIRVIRDRIRVLQVAGQPSWDVRALRGMLKQNPNVDLISFLILRTLDDINTAADGELSLIPFPTQELFEQELPSFDVVVLQNFNFGPYGLAPYLHNLRAYVEGGGGLIMLGGIHSFGAGGYAGTPIAGVLPVEVSVPGRSRLVDTERFGPTLTELGQQHPITMLRFDRTDNVALWAQLPELEGVNLIRGARTNAATLAVHPTLRDSSGAPLPVITAADVKEGRTLAVTTDSLWRWGFAAATRDTDGGGAYVRFWENAFRWLTHDPDLSYLKVNADAVEYEPGSAVELDVSLAAPDFRPLAGGVVKLTVRRGRSPGSRDVAWVGEIEVGEDGRGRHRLESMPEGVYRATATAEVAGRTVKALEIFVVRPASSELDHPAPESSLLVQVAGETGGLFLGPAGEIPTDIPFLQPRVVRVDERTDLELWSRPWLLIVALLLLGLEWGLRQQSGYL